MEIVDPSCTFCRTLTHNMKEAGLMDRANVTYLLYPIPLPEGGYKFPHSLLMASYLEATKRVPLSDGRVPPGDWQLLEKIFALPEGDGIDIQTQFNLVFTRNAGGGHDCDHARGDRVHTGADRAHRSSWPLHRRSQTSIAEQRRIAEEDIRTIKIPTLMWNDRRYDRVVSEEALRP
jgi:hypothetical protein